jgi:hypothetical protein
MSNVKYTLLLLVLLFCGSSCEEGFLDKAPDEDLTLTDVFAERQYAERFLTGTYNYLPTEVDFAETGGRNPFVGASDDMEMSWLNRFSHRMNSGSWGPTDVPGDHWSISYQALRRLNIFTENIGVTPMDEKAKSVWIGEAEFLKAFYHFLLIRLYGPIPIVDRSYNPNDDFTTMKRNTFSECVEFVVKKCDEAIALLPMNVPSASKGRATAAAALALKSRVLLYAASPLFNGDTDMAALVDKEGVKLFGDYNADLWQRAATAAKECIDKVEGGGYKLYRSASNDPVKNYQEIFTVRYNDEVLFARNLGVHTWQEMGGGANSEGGWSGLCPLQELVDAYEMADGSTPITGYNADGSPVINAASGYKETGYVAAAHPKGYYPAGVRNMYVDREPRFYATVNFNGAHWRGRNLQFWYSGAEGKSKGGAELYTVTGYLLKKFMDEDNVVIRQGRFVLETWVYFRLAEIYLNYAEALNEAQGPVADVHKYVNLVRARAGLPALAAGLTKAEMRERIRHERRVELSFETTRYFDTRRWKIAEQTNKFNMYVMNIDKGTNLQDDEFYKRTYFKRRTFEKKHYLWPINQGTINITPTLVQNPGW